MGGSLSPFNADVITRTSNRYEAFAVTSRELSYVRSITVCHSVSDFVLYPNATSYYALERHELAINGTIDLSSHKEGWTIAVYCMYLKI